MIILIKLFMAHLIGDFLLQPGSWVKVKEDRKLLAWQLYVHSALHGLLVLLLIWDLSFWIWALLFAVVHLIIDSFKILAQKNDTKRIFFFIDQLLHFISIYLIWVWYENQSISFSF